MKITLLLKSIFKILRKDIYQERANRLEDTSDIRDKLSNNYYTIAQVTALIDSKLSAMDRIKQFTGEESEEYRLHYAKTHPNVLLFLIPETVGSSHYKEYIYLKAKDRFEPIG